MTPAEVLETDRQDGEDLWDTYKAERGIWSERMLAALEEGPRGNKWFSLIDKVYSMRTLERAWVKVSTNAGACGVDGITVDHFGKDIQNRLLAVNEYLKRGDYQPKSVKRVWIPKAGGKAKRPLGMPTVQDRVVQCALKMVLEPIFEREFAAQSYGFRPGRGCVDALRRVDELLKSGKVHVVDIDIQGYFDNIEHIPLMDRVKDRVADGRVLALLERFLEQGVMEGLQHWTPEKGTPQGAVMSPLLANIFLNPLDWDMIDAGLEMVRYADDMVVLCHDAETAEHALNRVRDWMGRVGLTLHPEKTRIVDMSVSGAHFEFLGYKFWRGKGGNLRRFIRHGSRKKHRAKLKPMTRRTNGKSMEALVTLLNPILRGYYGYFKYADAAALRETDQWVRGRLRGILRNRQNRRGRARGKDHQLWPNHYFAELGLFCLEQARVSELANLRNGEKC